MTAAEALALSESAGVAVSLAGGFIRWQSHGDPPPSVVEALRAAKADLVALLARYNLVESGALSGDDLLADLASLDFRVRRYGTQAALDDETGQGRVPPMPLLSEFAENQAEYGLTLRVLRAPDALLEICSQQVSTRETRLSSLTNGIAS
jgi:hypothetical protein